MNRADVDGYDPRIGSFARRAGICLLDASCGARTWRCGGDISEGELHVSTPAFTPGLRDSGPLIPGSWSVEVVFNRPWSLPATPFSTLLTCEVERRHLEVRL